MVSDPSSSDLTHFFDKALEIQLTEPDGPLTEERLKRIALQAGLSEKDWEALCAKLNGHLVTGRNFLKFANHTDAITEMESAVAIAPYRADAMVDCGKAHLGRWKETGSRSHKDRAEFLFRKSLGIDPENIEAAELLSELKKAKPSSRSSGKKSVLVAVLALACGVTAWLGISGFTEKSDSAGVEMPIGLPEPGTAGGSSTSNPIYPSATLPQIGVGAPFTFDRDLVAYWSFDENSPGDEFAAGRHPLTKSGRVEVEDGVDGCGRRFFVGEKSGMFTQPSPEFDFAESVTVSAWVKPASFKSSQIVWFGDRQGGRDPWQLAVLDSGQVRFRSDRAVTSDPAFTMLPEEILVKPGNVPHLNQHVGADSPGRLPLHEWSFVTGRIKKTSSGKSVITVFVNGQPVSEVQTNETVDYGTEEMWITVGAVHDGNAQNFNGVIDEVRVYRSALTDEQIHEIYRFPRRDGAE